MVVPLWKAAWHVLIQLNVHVPCEPRVTFFWEKWKHGVHTGNCVHCSAASFMPAKGHKLSFSAT